MKRTTFSILIALAFLRGGQAGQLMAADPKTDAKEGGTVRKHVKWGYDDPDWTTDVKDWVALKAGEHPRLVFRQADLPGLKKRADTPEGKVMIARLNRLLDGKFTLWHPSGHGLLYQLTGDKEHANKAREQCIAILDGKKKDAKDSRYGFTNPGSGGAMRAGPAIAAMGLAYDLNYEGWDEEFRTKVARAILDNPFTARIASRGPIMPSCNHFGAAVGGVGIGLLAIRNDPGVERKKIDDLLLEIVKQVREEISIGYGDRGYYFEGHQCGRISSNTGLIPFLQAYRVAAGKDMVSKKDNARWLSAKWIYEFALDPDGKYTNAQRGMYARNFPREGMVSQQGDFSLGFGICPAEYVPALKWVYDREVEPGKTKTFDIIDYPHQAIYALANWPLDVKARNPAETLPRVLHDRAAGYVLFRNGWSETPGNDICVSALLGTRPTHQNGRGMASGGSVYVYGKGLGWGGQFARYRFPGIFYSSYPIYSKFDSNGSGVISAVSYGEKHNKFNLSIEETSKNPTSLAVDFSGASGAELLVAMVGPMVGHKVEYWMDVKPAKVADVKGANDYATKTTEVKLAGQRAYVMTLQKGAAPSVKQAGDKVIVGRQTISFDGKKLVLEPAGNP